MTDTSDQTGHRSSLEKMVVDTGVVKDHDHHDPANLLTVTPLVVSFSAIIGLSGWLIQFDTSYAGTVLQMETFQSSFGSCQYESNALTGKMGEMCTFTTVRQNLPSLGSLFIGVGGLFAGFIGSYLGRGTIIQLGCLLVIVGAAGIMGTRNN